MIESTYTSPPAWVWATLLGLTALVALAVILSVVWAAVRLARRPRRYRPVVDRPVDPGAPAPLTPGQRRGVVLVGIPAAVLALLGFGLAYRTMSARLEPTFGDYAGVAVIVIDLSIAVSSAAALLLLWIGIRIWWLRLVPWGLIAVSVALNTSGSGEWWEKVAHGAMPSLWSVFVEVVIIAVSRRLRVTEAAGERPRWGWRLITLPQATVPEMLAWTNHPRGGDITVDLAGAMEHRRRVRADKDAARAQRAADGLGRWPWMRARTHADALAVARARLVDEHDQAVADLVDQHHQAVAELVAQRDQAGAAVRLANERLGEARTAIAAQDTRIADLQRDVDVALTEAIAEAERATAAERALAQAQAGTPAGTGGGHATGILAGNRPGTGRASRREPTRAPGGRAPRNPAGTPTGSPALSKSEQMALAAADALERGEKINGAELARRYGADDSLGRKVLAQVRQERAGLHAVPA